MIKDAPEDLAQVLSLRQQLAKSSVKKYQAMQNAACNDHRTRGMFQFYGANRTGRWAGRLIQLQNLPQNHMDDLDAARKLVCIGDYDSLSMLSALPSLQSLDTNSMWLTLVQSKLVSLLTWRENHGVQRYSKMVVISTVHLQVRCFMSLLRSTELTDTFVKKVKLQN